MVSRWQQKADLRSPPRHSRSSKNGPLTMSSLRSVSLFLRTLWRVLYAADTASTTGYKLLESLCKSKEKLRTRESGSLRWNEQIY